MSENLTNLARVIAKNPTSSLFARLADAYLQSGDVHRAIEVCRQGLRYRPSYVSGHVVLGKSHFAAGMFEEARRAFNKALHLDPHHTVAIWYLGQIDRTMGWDDLALRNFQKARDLDPLSQNLGRATEEVLASISSQMDQRLQEEALADRDPSAETVEQERAGLPDRPEEAWDGEDRRAREVEDEREPEPEIPETPAPAPDRNGLRPDMQNISRLLEEIQVSAPPGEADETRAEPSPESPPEDRESPGDETAPPTVEAVPPPSERAPEDPDAGDASPGRTEPADSAPTLSVPPARRVREAPRKEGRTGGGLALEDLPIVTATLGEIYAGQGFIAQAVAIFEKVLEREPGNARAQERLKTLREQSTAGASG